MFKKFFSYTILKLLLISPVLGSEFPGVHQLDDNFYFGKMRSQAGKELWLVMERVNDLNHDLFLDYITVQTNALGIQYQCSLQDKNGKLYQKGATGDGSKHFERVLREVSYRDNEIWVAYISRSTLLPKKISPCLLGHYTVEDTTKGWNPFAKDIEMFVTVSSSPNALITSHMGVASTLEGVTTRQKGTSVDLHSFCAKVMWMRNQGRRFMANAPVIDMEQIVVKALPDFTFIGTREMREKMQKTQGVGLKEFERLNREKIKTELREKGVKEASSIHFNLECDIRLLKEGRITDHTEESLLKDAFERLPSYTLLELNNEGRFVVSEAKVESRYLKELEGKFLRFKNPCPFPPAKSRENQSVEFLKFMEQHPPILSVTRKDDQVTFTVFDPENPDTPWLTINESNASDYNWISQSPFAPAGNTHYMAVDLLALAKSRPLLELAVDDYKNLGSPYSVVISDEDYADPKGNAVESLENNSSVVDLTIHSGFAKWDWNQVQHKNYNKLVSESLWHKPNLKRLTVIGDFDVDLFFNAWRVCIGNDPLLDPETYLDKPNLAFFATLQELHVTGRIYGANRNSIFFEIDFIGYLEKRKKLQKFTTKESLQN